MARELPKTGRAASTEEKFSYPQISLGCAEFFGREILKHSFTRAIETPEFPVDCPDCLRGAPLISMVKATDLWNLNDPVRLIRLNGSTFWSVLIQRQVRARFVIIAKIIFEQSTQMVVIEDDHVI